MAQKFDPVPADKHAEPTKNDRRRDAADDELEQGLKGSFPASDPTSTTQPTKTDLDYRR
jgi:hypothetical protein